MIRINSQLARRLLPIGDAVFIRQSLSTCPCLHDRHKQPTGRAGMPSPWLRTPFFHERGPAPGIDLSLQERLDVLYDKEPHIGERVNIGFAAPDKSDNSRDGKRRVSEWRRLARSNKHLEKAAREGTLDVDLSEVRRHWLESGAVFDDIMSAADLYGVYDDMFGHAYFRPCVVLDINYKIENAFVPVYRGNMIKPAESASTPTVKFDSDEDSLWCLMMTGLDSHFQSESDQYLHWMVTNIKGGDLSTGHVVCDYLQPFPAFGTGYHRYSFVLFKQDELINVDKIQENDGIDLEARTFNTLNFYQKHQDNITPAGLAFFQSDFDKTLRDFFHNKLQMKEPRFEYEFPDWYVAPWMFHIAENKKDGFDEFMDRHRDPKDLEREVLEAKLKHTDPFQGDTEAYIKYPGIHQIELEDVFPPPPGEKRLHKKQSYKMAQWRRNAIQKQRMRQRYFRSSEHSDLRRDPSMNN